MTSKSAEPKRFSGKGNGATGAHSDSMRSSKQEETYLNTSHFSNIDYEDSD